MTNQLNLTTLNNVVVKDFNENIKKLAEGHQVFDVVPNVRDDKEVDEWINKISKNNFYVKLNVCGPVTDIYYASLDFLEEVVDEYTTHGWTKYV